MKKNCYVILPDDTYAREAMTEIYEPAILESGNFSSFSPQASNPGKLMKSWWSHLRKADIVLVHMDGIEKGVLYQLGMAHSLSLPVILVAPVGFMAPKHLINSKIIHYDPKSPRWVANLASDLQDKLKIVSESPESSIELNIGIGNEPANSPIFKKGKLLNLLSKLNAQSDMGSHQPDPEEISKLQSEIEQLKKKLSEAKKAQETPTVPPPSVKQEDLKQLHQELEKLRTQIATQAQKNVAKEPKQLEKLPEDLENRVSALLTSGASKLDIYRYLRDLGYSNSESFGILEAVEKGVQ